MTVAVWSHTLIFHLMPVESSATKNLQSDPDSENRSCVDGWVNVSGMSCNISLHWSMRVHVSCTLMPLTGITINEMGKVNLIRNYIHH